ncbi:hypothetical protein BH09PAT4_BH09PAT4_09620 [soil metagenome]
MRSSELSEEEVVPQQAGRERVRKVVRHIQDAERRPARHRRSLITGSSLAALAADVR